MRPYDSDDLTQIIEEREGQFLVYRSPATAEHYPHYARIGKFPALQQASAIASPSNGDPVLRADERCPYCPLSLSRAYMISAAGHRRQSILPDTLWPVPVRG